MHRDPAIEALRSVDFDWVRRLKDVWRDDPAHVPELNQAAFGAVVAAFDRMNLASPLGRVVVGPAGAGKTHLLGALRARIADRGWFVLVDMTDVRDFWETVLQGYLESLREALPDGRTQFHLLLQEVLARLAQGGGTEPGADYARVLQALRTQPLAGIKQMAQSVIGRRVAIRHPNEAREHQDVLRALLLLNAEDFEVSNLGHSWLLGLDLDDAQRRECGFAGARRDQKHVVQGLSWLMSLARPTLLALDQMDAIVGQHAAASRAGESQEQAAAQSILFGIGNGLLALRDTTHRTMTLLSCLEATWYALTDQTVRPVIGRFEPPQLLQVESAGLARRMIEARLAGAFSDHEFSAPYPSWPFRPEAFEGPAGLRSPREILMDCAAHRDACVAAGQVRELSRLGESHPARTASPAADPVARRFEELLALADPDGLIDDAGEDTRLGALIATACVCAVREIPATVERDLLVDIDFPGGTRAPPLHARLRLVEHDQGGRERHYSFRALNRSHATAFQNRLRLAANTSGISSNLSFRRLVILRNRDVPRGDKTQSLTAAFIAAGGRFAPCSVSDLKRLLAIEALLAERPPGLDPWLRAARPASVLNFLQESGFVEEGRTGPPSATPAPTQAPAAMAPPAPIESPASPAAAVSISAPAPAPSAANDDRSLVIGERLGVGITGPVSVALAALTKHIAVLASPGSGKTVLLRRLVEEAALFGIPSIVVDPGNDLARLGDAWPVPPSTGWNVGDAEKAEAFLANVDVRIWTPGKSAGRPMNLGPLPNFMGLDGEEKEQAIDMAAAALGPIVAPGRNATAERRKGVLTAALKHFAAIGASGIDSLIELLQELPPEASSGDTQAHKLAVDMANLMRAQRQGNALWRQEGAALDPAELFGIGARRTRVSVINLMGLPTLDAQQGFVNALAMSLFGWIRRHPAPVDRPLRGLLVLDEAKDFVPSRQMTVCKGSLLRLAAQARKYGLGLIFASQEPQSIDHYVVSSCATQIYGKAGSQPAIERVRSQMQDRGGRGDDIARLAPGQFYVSAEGDPTPVKTATPMCLTWHAATPLAPDEVLERARRSGADSA